MVFHTVPFLVLAMFYPGLVYLLSGWLGWWGVLLVILVGCLSAPFVHMALWHWRRLAWRMVLTTLGRMLLGLGDLDEHRAEQKRKARERRQADATKKQDAEAELEQRRRELEHIAGHGDDGGGGQGELGQMPTGTAARQHL